MSRATDEDKAFYRGLLAAVEERGREFVYPEEWRNKNGACTNRLKDGSPACIMGLAATNAGFVIPRSGPVGEWSHSIGLSDTVSVAALVTQRSQDKRRTWGECLDEFHLYLLVNGPLLFLELRKDARTNHDSAD